MRGDVGKHYLGKRESLSLEDVDKLIEKLSKIYLEDAPKQVKEHLSTCKFIGFMLVLYIEKEGARGLLPMTAGLTNLTMLKRLVEDMISEHDAAVYMT